MSKSADPKTDVDKNPIVDPVQEPRPTLGLKTPDVESMTDRDRDQAGASLDPREQAAHEPDRPKRVSMQGSMKLSIPANLIKPDHTARWWRDKDARIAQAHGAYWEHIMSEGKKLCRPSGPYMLYAMQLHNKYVAEDNLLKRNRIAARLSKEAAIGAGEFSNHGTDSALAVDSSNPFK